MTKKTAGHTPGPWHVSNGSNGDRLGIRASKGIPVLLADIIPHLPINGIPQEANAHLIAASPDMLGALKRFAHAIEQGRYPELQGVASDAFAAIAKAEGREVR